MTLINIEDGRRIEREEREATDAFNRLYADYLRARAIIVANEASKSEAEIGNAID
jgi:hypothetical protein